MTHHTAQRYYIKTQHDDTLHNDTQRDNTQHDDNTL